MDIWFIALDEAFFHEEGLNHFLVDHHIPFLSSLYYTNSKNISCWGISRFMVFRWGHYDTYGEKYMTHTTKQEEIKVYEMQNNERRLPIYKVTSNVFEHVNCCKNEDCT